MYSFSDKYSRLESTFSDIIRYRQDGQRDTKTDMVMVVVDGLVGGKETGRRRSDVDRLVKCIEIEGIAIVL